MRLYKQVLLGSRFTGLILGAVLAQCVVVEAIVPFTPPADIHASLGMFADDAGVSYSNPRSHGDMRPRLSGKINSVALKVSGRSLSWTGLVHAKRGAIQMWGEPALQWSDQSLQQIESQLKNLVDANFSAFQIKSKDLVLNKKRTTLAGAHRTVTFDRVFWLEGAVRFKVENAFVSFRFKQGRLVQITNFSFGEIGIIEAPMISPDDALTAVADDVLLQEGVDRLDAKVDMELQPFFIANGDVRFRMVYKVTAEKKRPRSYWNYAVSAADGSIAQIVNGLHSAMVTADVSPRLATDELVSVPMPFAKVTGREGDEFTDGRGEYRQDPQGIQASLKGKIAKISRYGHEEVKEMSQPSGDVHFAGKTHLDEAMTYFHINRVNAYVQQFIQNDFLKKAISVNTQVKDGPMKYCNAWYSPYEKTLNFLPAGNAQGTNCESTGRIADVMYHEWGHALDDALGGINDGAFSEGIGDITSFILTGDSRLAPGFFKGTDTPIRDASTLKVYPRDRSNNPHAEGLIIAGAWWDALNRMKEVLGPDEGTRKTAEIFFKHLVTADSYLESYQAALLIDDNDGDLSNCTPHLCIFNAAFAKRGLTPYDDRCKNRSACGSTELAGEEDLFGGLF